MCVCVCVRAYADVILFAACILEAITSAFGSAKDADLNSARVKATDGSTTTLPTGAPILDDDNSHRVRIHTYATMHTHLYTHVRILTHVYAYVCMCVVGW